MWSLTERRGQKKALRTHTEGPVAGANGENQGVRVKASNAASVTVAV